MTKFARIYRFLKISAVKMLWVESPPILARSSMAAPRPPWFRRRTPGGFRWFQPDLAVFLVLGPLLAACSTVATQPSTGPIVDAAPTSAPPTRVSVALDWFPWSNHSGLYIARERGYFADEGLEVEIFTPGDPTTVLQTVASGRDDFGISYQTEVLIARQSDVPVVSIMAMVQHPLDSVMALESSGISSPQDLVGKTVGWPGGPSSGPLLDTMLKSQGRSLADVEMINVGYDLVPALIGGEVDAIVGAYWVHESISATNLGFPVNIMRMEQHGVPDFYELVMVANEDMIAENPDLVQRFVRGAMRGYQDAIADPPGAVQLLKAVRPEVDLAIESPGVELLAPLWQPDGGQGFGWQEEARWVDYARWMEESGLLNDGSTDSARAAFDNSFVAQASQ
jgi:putative hydroxymethylpyrimidine transport system substrate-binding protein